MLEPLLAIFAIIIPIGFACLIVMLQARKMKSENYDHRNSEQS
jgi:hypothetical protein